MVEEPEAVIEAGLNEAEAPAGRPLAVSDTLPVKPVPAVTTAEKEVLPPGEIVLEAGEADIEKSGGALTVIVRVGGLGSVRPALSVTVKVVT